MLSISYTISPFLIRYLDTIETARKRIILRPLSPKNELSRQFEASINRIFYGLTLAGQTVTQEEVKRTLLQPASMTEKKKNRQKINTVEQYIIGYRDAMTLIKQEWLVSDGQITVKTLTRLYSIIGKGHLKIPEKKLQEVLDYLQVSSDNAFIQAGIAKLVFAALDAFTEDNELFSIICAYLFLYKSGMDCRGLLVIEEAWAKEQTAYTGQYKTALTKPNITGWLEYFVKTLNAELEHTYQSIIKNNTLSQTSVQETVVELNDRQKAILAILDNPAAVITNRTIQKKFGISQITASRDLSKLASLGLLFIHGKGRSVRYTRV
jgi:Fic family protein